ncbi:MAG: cupin domain-containing protein [Gammaproteobacteria bacterium]|nr:cupin domain-containing protein [Gammaproteobacteria bacterium]
MIWQLQGFDRVEFIQQYWQKKPCLMRQAFAIFQSPVSPEELAGLACEEGVHSRLVIEKDAETPWQLSYGPFSEDEFRSLPASHYSLLVSECEMWIPEFAELLDEFRFIPSWRIDDLMVSYAPLGGSVGPHSDEYDVFLLQAQGHRKWQYTNSRVENPTLLAGLELAIMQDFTADQEAVLAPGDMLYLPPGIAHHGVALDPCLTYSIGFRAATAVEVLESFILEADRRNLGSQRYCDRELEVNRHFAEITDTEVDRFKNLALSLLDAPRQLWVDTAGKLLSDSVINDFSPEQPPARLDELFQFDWLINPETKMLYHRGNSSISFYCNGQSWELPNSDQVITVIQALCEHRVLAASTLEACGSQPELSKLLIELVNNGAIVRADQ